MKLLTIVGARPQFIKAAVVCRELATRSGFQEILVHTGQHYDANMSDVFFEDLNIPRPTHFLGIGGVRHGEMTGRQLVALEEVMVAEKPDWVLVYGDTNTTLAGALAAVKLHVPVAHVEAGLRSFNRGMPEEINRVVTDHVSTLLFTPTQAAVKNLRREGISDDQIINSGDVMYDAALYYSQMARPPRGVLDSGLESGKFILATIHRAENTDDLCRLRSILAGLGDTGRTIILPLHPRTRQLIARHNLALPEAIHVIDPVGYLEMTWLEKHCCLIATDSGGVQKEAYFHSKPCVTLRDETEWVELVESGWNHIAGSNARSIEKLIRNVRTPSTKPNFYGIGDAARRIVDALHD